SSLFFNFKRSLLLNTIAVALFLPHIGIFLQQMSYGGIGSWLGKPDEDWFWRFLSYCFNDSDVLIGFCALLVGMSLFLSFKEFPFSKFHVLCLLWFILPFFIGYYYSKLVNPVLQYSTLLFGFPFLLLLIFSFAEKALRGSWKYSAVVLTLVIGFYSTVVEGRYYQKNHFAVFKEIAEDTKSW